MMVELAGGGRVRRAGVEQERMVLERAEVVFFRDSKDFFLTEKGVGWGGWAAPGRGMERRGRVMSWEGGFGGGAGMG
jgi:hypothetical protein